jgi:hypothetical protein
MKKCTEEIQGEAIRKLKRKYHSLKFYTGLLIFFLVVASLFYSKYRDSRIFETRKQLIVSICTELNDLNSFFLQGLGSPTTYGELQQKYNNFVGSFKIIKTKIISELAKPLKKDDKILVNNIFILVNIALAISENKLRATNYALQNFASEKYIKSEQTRAQDMRFFDTFGTNKVGANQIDQDIAKELEIIKSKSKMIDALVQENLDLYLLFQPKIYDLGKYLDKYGLNFEVLFPSESQEISDIRIKRMLEEPYPKDTK